jgi:hypothetical protein
VDLGDVNPNYGTLQSVKELATHRHMCWFSWSKVLSTHCLTALPRFLLLALRHFNFSLCFGGQLLFLNYRAIWKSYIAFTADGASPNRKFVWKHKVSKK